MENNSSIGINSDQDLLEHEARSLGLTDLEDEEAILREPPGFSRFPVGLSSFLGVSVLGEEPRGGSCFFANFWVCLSLSFFFLLPEFLGVILFGKTSLVLKTNS